MGELRTEFETIVIGGGYGGLAAGALLAKRGEDVCLLEGHTITGGCGGCFDRFERNADGSVNRYRFDVGATTLSGLHKGGPIDRLMAELDQRLSLHKVDPGLIMHFRDGTQANRWSDPERWINECERLFNPKGQRRFWEQVFSTNRRGWRLSEINPTFPPKSPGDLLRMVRPENLRNIDLLPYARRSVQDIVNSSGIDRDPLFHRFIREQLMITSQNVAADTPFLVGAMGLAYPSDTWYIDGGMYALADWMVKNITTNRGQVRTKRRVKSLRREGDAWVVQTNRETYRAKRIICNATTFDLADLLPIDEGTQIWEANRHSLDTWGAFTLYAAVKNMVNDGGSLYHQIECESLPYCGSTSIFTSLSPPGDRMRAPEGWRTVTVSAHVASPKEWCQLSSEDSKEYERRKREVGELILAQLERALPGFGIRIKKFVLFGTPRTFDFYTGRQNGAVGGIPHSMRRSLFTMPKYRSPLPNLYLVGDTVYPGQGIPAVILGALNLIREIA